MAAITNPSEHLFKHKHDKLKGLSGGASGEYNHITDSELVVLQNTSGVNTGNQDLSGLVPYAGATGSVNVGAHSVIATQFKIGSNVTIEFNAALNSIDFIIS